MAPYVRTSIDSGWQFKQVGALGVPEWNHDFLPVAQFPTNVHLDLMAHNMIPDPFLGLNEFKIQWVGEQKWLYRTNFVAHHQVSAPEGAKLVLQFEGLDTFANVVLNGVQILTTDNMHRTFCVDVSDNVRCGKNELEILFDSAIIRGMELMEETSFRPAAFTKATDKSRMLVRKAQYHYAWNWGPEIMTCGPWRPIYLEYFSARICDLSSRVSISVDDQTAKIVVTAETEDTREGDVISFTMMNPDGNIVEVIGPLGVEKNNASATFHLKNARFWWPVGYGEHPLYRISAELSRKAEKLHEFERRIGLRQASIVVRPLADAPGTTFFLEVNNVPIFSSGSNWCPADHFVPRISKERYRTLLELFAQANQNMIRVWGGGVYEEDIFYDVCDELGILVWNDFMFACGTYPADEPFIKNITAEVEDNLKRIRHHPSVVIWAGNNEDYLFAELFNTTYDKTDSNPENWLKSTFPARYIYEKILPDMCATLIPDTSYHPGSPWGGEYFNDPTVGDTHMWEVWHRDSLPWQEYPRLGSRFISEFGIGSLPHVKTIESYLVGLPASERHPHSRTVDDHNKEYNHERKLAAYLIENFKFGYDLEEYVYISQLNQAEAMSCALRAWRRGWKGPGKEYCGGNLIWQFNPTWQVTSKALIDYYNRPKMAYFTVKRDIAPISLGMERKEIKHPRFKHTRAFVDTETRILGWVTNTTLKPVTLVLHIQAFEFSTGKEVFSNTEIRELGANITTELFDLELPKSTSQPDEPVIISTSLTTLPKEGLKPEVIARCTNWPQPYRYLDMPKPSLDVRIDGDTILVKTNNVPVKGLAFYAEEVDEVKFEDNLIDLVPGDEQVIMARGLNGRPVDMRYYGM